MAERGTRADIDLSELERLCAIQCTDEEIGAWFGVSTRTIERRRLEPEWRLESVARVACGNTRLIG